MNPQTTEGMAASSSMSDLQRFLELAAAELGDVDRRPQPQRHRQQHGQAGHRQRAHQQREGAELRSGSEVGRHSRTGEELDEVQLAEKHRRRFAEHEEKNGKDEKDRAPAAKADDPLHQRFGPVQGQVDPAGEPAGGTPRPGTRSEATHGSATGTYPSSSTTFWPSLPKIQSRKALTLPFGSPAV